MARGEKLIIGPRLKALRQNLGLTQAQMAEQLRVSPSYITLIEADQRPASARLLMRLAEVFDLNVAELAPSHDTQLATDLTATLKDPALEAAHVTRTEIEQALVAALNEQRLIIEASRLTIEALEQRIVALEGQERFALTEDTPQALMELMEELCKFVSSLEQRYDDLEQIVERRGLGTSWPPNRDALMKIVEADERRLG